MVKALTVAALCLSVSNALAQEVVPHLLRGPEAFGDWRNDAPGIRRLITPKDLPPPGESKQRESKIVSMPNDATPKVPPGFMVERIAGGLTQPRVVRVAPNGDLFVATSKANEIRVYRLHPESANIERQDVFATGLKKPYGIAFYPPGDHPEWVYVANTDSVVRFRYSPGDTKASSAPERIIEGIPSAHHWTRDIAFSPDGKTLYLAVGSGSNVALDMFPEPMEPKGLAAWNAVKPLGATWDTEEDRAAVLSFSPDGGNRRLYVTGIRNPAGIAIQPATGDLWAVVNERDGLGDDTPFEYATHLGEGMCFGWPWYYIGSNEDPRYPGKRPDLRGRITVPDVLMQAHSAALQIAFYNADAFPADYKGSAFVALHGSWDREKLTGYKVVRLLFDRNHKATGAYEDFMTGFVVSDTEVWGRPVGVAVAKDGSLIVTEDGNGTIWRVSYRRR
ncbi:hypothetical protein PHYC_02846 [Phycisphaerales bacterium]|nr:hypothetical protein PHYC_02846 [Phycisphaerales bacterium]